MKRSIARKWAAALESGDYKQGKNQLRKGNSFCCLGVLCNIHAQEHPEIAAKQKKKSWYMSEEAVLPDEVMAWAGMDSFDGYIDWDNRLTTLNDSGVSFAEIAKIIRKRWKEL